MLRAGVGRGALLCVALLAALAAMPSPSAARGAWIRKAGMPTPREFLSANVVDGRVYAIGGGGFVRPSDARVEMYDPATDTWTRRADMPTDRGYLATAVVDGRIYAFAGVRGVTPNQTFPRAVEVYDPASDTWAHATDMPEARINLAVGAVDGRIYVIGGQDPEGGNPGVVGAVEAYDPATDTWSPKADLPTPRRGLSACVVDALIYSIGGVDNQDNMVGVVEAYDPATDTWVRKADMPTARGWLTTAALDGRIYAIGGFYWDNSTPDGVGVLSPGVVEVYDPVTDAWVRGTDLPGPRGGLGAGAVDGKLYVVGGASGYGAPESGDLVLSSSTEVLYATHPELIERATPQGMVAAGREYPLALEVVLREPLPAGTDPVLQLDMSQVPGAAPVSFVGQGQGRFAADIRVLTTTNGWYALPVWLDPGGTAPLLLYTYELTVVPAGSQLLFGDESGTGWTWEAASGATLDPAATTQIHQGDRALAVRATASGWRLTCTAASPLDRVGYEALRLALHPGDATGAIVQIRANGRPYQDLRRWVDWGTRSWQIVELPLDSLKLDRQEAISSFTLYGTVKGTFYLDDVELVSAPVPTAVFEERDAAGPSALALAQSYPNPFNGATVISFALPEAAAVDLEVYNLAGQRVATLAQGHRAAGSYRLTWDGRDDAGQSLASGVYLYRLRVGDRQQEARKLLFLR